MSQTVVVTLGPKEGMSASHAVVDGWRLTIPAIVTGLNQDKTASGPKLMSDAIKAVIAVVGDRGSSCPDIYVPNGWPPYLESFGVPEVIDFDKVKVTIHYRGYPLSQYRLSSSLFETQTNLDKDGNPIKLRYTYSASSYEDIPCGAEAYMGQTKSQSGLVPDERPDQSFTINFVLISVGPVSALYQATQMAVYGGKLNKSTYTIGAISGGPRTWKWTAINGHTVDGGMTINLEMTVTYREIGWDKLVVFIDPFSGKPPADVSDQPDAAKIPNVAPEIDFPTFIMSGN